MAKKDKEAVETTEEMDADHADLRVYEIAFHLDPELSLDEAKKAYDALRSIAGAAGTVIAEGEPQKIPLAYTIFRSENAGRRDFDASYFAWVAYEANGAGHDKVLEAVKGEHRIFRFLDIRTDKEAAKHSEEMHELMAKAGLEENREPEISDAELDNALKEVGV